MKFQLAFRFDVSMNASFVISRVTGSPYHVAMLFDDECIEAVAGAGVRSIGRAERLEVGDWKIRTVNATPDGVAAAYAFARSQIGKRYDYPGVLYAWALGRIAGEGFAWWWYCSKIAARCVIISGAYSARHRAAYFTPARLFRIFPE